MKNKIQWVIEPNSNYTKFLFKKILNGKVIKKYRPCSSEEAFAWASRVICNLQLDEKAIINYAPPLGKHITPLPGQVFDATQTEFQALKAGFD